MTCEKIIKYIEDWAPKEIAWDRDNVGLQVGSSGREVNNILLALDVNRNVVSEAVRKNCNLIITHHPLLFNPLKKIVVDRNRTSALIEQLIKKDITLFSAHTNLDYTKDGVSFALAKTLKLEDLEFLAPVGSIQYKLVIFVPADSAEKVARAVFDMGGGIIGEYSRCSFRTEGTGTFMGSSSANPVIGKKGTYSHTAEIKLEILIDAFKLEQILSAVRRVHPYEEIAYDIIELKNKNINFGAGAIGSLQKPLGETEFLKHVASSLGTGSLRYTAGRNKKISRVAVCGGSGSEYIISAVRKNADAFITGDIKYHAFFDTQGEVLLVDAGHYETEVHSLNEIKRRLTGFLKGEPGIKVFKYSGTTNPIIFYNN